MARAIVRKTTTIERDTDADPVAQMIRDALSEFPKLDASKYVESYFAAAGTQDSARLDVFKRVSGHMMKMGAIQVGEIDPADAESHLIACWRPGNYQLRPNIGGRYYAPSSMLYQIGEVEESQAGPRGDDVATAANAVANMALVKQLKEIKEGLADKPKEDEGMKAAEVGTMIQTAMEPFKLMLESANRRAEAAEGRNHELQMKLLDMAQSKSTAQAAGIPDLLKLLPKEAVTALLSPAEGPGWVDKAIDALREFGPALTQMLTDYFKRPEVQTAARGALPESAGQANPQPTGGGPAPGGAAGGRGVPIQLNEEQQEAKKVMLECVREGDYANAFAMLEAFPGFVPTGQGPMPVGPAVLGMIDPAVTRPRIYVIQMMQLIPEFRDLMPQAEAFVTYIQKRLMEDQEAALRERRVGAGPKPTGIEEDRDGD